MFFCSAVLIIHDFTNNFKKLQIIAPVTFQIGMVERDLSSLICG